MNPLMEKLKARQARSQPTAPMAEPTATHDIERNLAINPPPVTEAPVEAVTPMAAAQAAQASEAPTEGVPSTHWIAEGLTPCPTCGKGFKHLSRHRCKGSKPVETSVSEVELPTAAALGVILPALRGEALDLYAAPYGITRAHKGDPAYDDKFRSTIRKLMARERSGGEPVETVTEPVETGPAKEATEETGSFGEATPKVDVHVGEGADVNKVAQTVATAVAKLGAAAVKTGQSFVNKPDVPQAPWFDLVIGAEVTKSETLDVIHFYDVAYSIEKQCKKFLGMSWIEVEFGKGKAALIECLQARIEAGELTGQTVVVSTRSHTYSIVADLLRHYARNVIVGVQ